MGKFEQCILSTRPWSFSAAIIPVIVTTAVSHSSFLSFNFVRAIIMGVSVQAGANLTNTYFDFVNKVDTIDNGEITIVQKILTKSEVLFLSILFYGIALFTVLNELLLFPNVSIPIFAIGLFLSFFYTANPVGLKYKALGDITIFFCFGPLLMQFISIILTGTTNDKLYLYSVPIGLLTEAILHTNNARDIKADSLAGAMTLASLLGPKLTYKFFVFLILGSYISVSVIAWMYHWGCLAALLTIPLALTLDKNYCDGKMTLLPNETAQLHLPFGLLMFLGIMFTNNGFFEESLHFLITV